MTWDTNTWKPWLRLLLGIATIWPIIYIVLFVTLIFSGFFFAATFGRSADQSYQRLDLIQLEKKIQDGEIRELLISADEIRAYDRDGREFQTRVDNDSTREEIIRQARANAPDGSARVSKINEDTSRPRVSRLLPFGFLVLFAFHALTMALLFLLMPLYIILPLKNETLDQNMRIVWVILACTVGAFSDVVYWYLHVWRKPPIASQLT